jgi:DNA gyrase inhibitor GyrI
MEAAGEIERRDQVIGSILAAIRSDVTIKLPSFDPAAPGSIDDGPYWGTVGEYRYQFEGEEDLLHLFVSRVDHGKLSVEEAQQVVGFLYRNVPRALIWLKPGEFSQHFYLGHDELLTYLDGRIHYGSKVTLRLPSSLIPMKITIEDRPAYHVIGFPHKGAYWQIGETFQKLAQWKAANRVVTGHSIAVYHDDPEKTPVEELRSDALFIVPDPAEVTEGMVVYTIPAGRYLVGQYVGAYEGLPRAWGQFFGQELPKANVTPSEGYTFEWYVDDCSEVPAEQLRTDLLVPIESD